MLVFKGLIVMKTYLKFKNIIKLGHDKCLKFVCIHLRKLCSSLFSKTVQNDHFPIAFCIL
jgi:hypothetical protein